MPIIELCNATDEGARGAHNGAGHMCWSMSYDERREREKAGLPIDCQGPTAYWTRLTHVGLCLRDYEHNGTDDSDFHMIVWDPVANEPKDICFASTRGWSYPCYGSAPDATPDVVEKYQLYLDGIQRIYKMEARKAKAAELRAMRNALKVATRTHKVPYQKVLKARRSLQWEQIKYLLTAPIRSKFKKSLRQHVIDWFNDPNPAYQTPLSKKQLAYAVPSEPLYGRRRYA